MSKADSGPTVKGDTLRVGIDVAQLSDRALTGIPLYIEGLLREFLGGSHPVTPSFLRNSHPLTPFLASERGGNGLALPELDLTLVGSQWGTDLAALLRRRGISQPAAILPAAEYRLGERLPRFAQLPIVSWLARKWDGRVALPLGNAVTSRRVSPPLDVFHHTSILRIHPSRARANIVTIYDLTTRFYPETHNAVNLHEWERVYAFGRDRADLVITDSESARNDIIEHLGIPGDRVRAIPLGLRPLPEVTDADIAAAREKFGLAGARFVLAVGTLEPRKNLPRLISAFAAVCAEPGLGDLHLVLTGARLHGADAVDAAVSDLGPEVQRRVHRTGYVSDGEVAALLRACDVFAYPSLYEGFGLPVLEAMALGAPVVTSHVSSLPEVAGDAALLVDPHDTDALAGAMARLLNDSRLSADLRRRGVQRAAGFTNARTAEAHLRLYHEVAGRPVA